MRSSIFNTDAKTPSTVTAAPKTKSSQHPIRSHVVRWGASFRDRSTDVAGKMQNIDARVSAPTKENKMPTSVTTRATASDTENGMRVSTTCWRNVASFPVSPNAKKCIETRNGKFV